MKPIVTLDRKRCDRDRFMRGFPLIDCNYQPGSAPDFWGGQHTNFPAPSFRNISRNYFREEAQRHFVIEAFFFAGVVLTAIAALAVSALAVIDFLRVLGHF
jgi:hypothetical protein